MAEEIGLDGDAGPPLRACCTTSARRPITRPKAGIPKIGADLLKRYGEGPEVVHAALGHHDDIRIEHPYTVLVAAADACSASRPGARRETLERYIKRMEELESIARGFPGVEQAFAIQAGRELRVIASAKDTDDGTAAKICRDIAKAFEEQLTYPGEIKVTVLRETRFTEVADKSAERSGECRCQLQLRPCSCDSSDRRHRRQTGTADRRPCAAGADRSASSSTWSSPTPRTRPAARASRRPSIAS